MFQSFFSRIEQMIDDYAFLEGGETR